jgi:16S rRNA (adenine1518-N6/adenine1519-N6)-dimethyltransferase
MPLSPTQTRALLEHLGHHPKKALGQNFLIDGNIVRKSTSLAGLHAGDRVVEVGPGLGTLTEAMLDLECDVHAVELDDTLATYLKERFKNPQSGQFSLTHGDAVKFPRADLSPTNLPYKVVANLPYAITSPWLDTLLSGAQPEEMVLMVQKEAAQRITAPHGSKAFGAVSIFVGSAYDRCGTFPVSRSCFYPAPGVDSVLLHLKRKSVPFLFTDSSRERIRNIFTHRRKQIGNLLREPELLDKWMTSAAVRESNRPEEIATEAWQVLDAILRETDSGQESNKSC